jgi:outer membrane receptor protein involved in Fe transport
VNHAAPLYRPGPGLRPTNLRSNRHPHLSRTLIATCIATLCHAPLAAAAEKADPAVTLSTVEVVGTTPLPGVDLPLEQIPANVQVVKRRQIEDPGSATLTDVMNRSLGSVFINEIQNNPYQADVNYRGFTASPLLGTPQGLSVYMDGVRLNQPFGDVVSWDLIPRSAISSMSLMPGSNPVFGLNTLGGALSIQTKDGYSAPGTAVQALYGSHGRGAAEFEHGGHNERGLNWFVTGNAFTENGWRDDSPSSLGQLFGKLGWAGDKTDLALTVALAKGKLTGNGLQEKRLLDADYDSLYTKPDITRNRSLFLNLAGKHSVSDDLLLAGNAYYRKIRTRTLNGDLNDEALENAGLQSLDCIGSADPDDDCNGLHNRTRTQQENWGLTGQFTAFGKLAGHKNQFTAGAGYDASRTRFKQTTQFGYLNADRSITPIDVFEDDNAVDLQGRQHTWSLFATDTLSINDVWHLTLSGRYNRTTVKNRDQITPGGGSGSLDGDHHFDRFNPAVGLSITPSKEFNVYAGYNEGSRAPTVVELGCADPANPCKLPNAMAGDPPLKQVVTKTWEAGLRGALGERTRWNAGLFRAENHDDILFVADDSAGFGYFKNFGKTRRQGVELGLSSEVGKLTLAANYTFLHATFQSEETVNGEANSSQDADGNIAIKRGDRIPLLPRHIVKLHADWQLTDAWSFGLGMQAVSSSVARGNENGKHHADGVNFLGSGKSAGYAVFDLSGKYKASKQLSLFAQVNNLFDRKHATAAQLGATGFTADGAFFAPGDPLINSTFSAAGAPRTGWVGARYEFK